MLFVVNVIEKHLSKFKKKVCSRCLLIETYWDSVDYSAVKPLIADVSFKRYFSIIGIKSKLSFNKPCAYIIDKNYEQQCPMCEPCENPDIKS